MITPEEVKGPYFGSNEDVRGNPMWVIARNHNQESIRLNGVTTLTVRRKSTRYYPTPLR